MRFPLRFAVALAALVVTACGAHTKVLVSRGSTVPMELQTMSEDQLHEYFKADELHGYKDGSSIDVSVVMVDHAYFKATGQTMEATDEEMEYLTSHKRFEVKLEYKTHNLFPGDYEAGGIAIEKWNITLRDSTGTEITPEGMHFDQPLMQKSASEPEETLGGDESKLMLTYILKGQLIFEYDIPRDAKWVELTFAPPIAGHDATVRWVVLN